MLEKHRYWIIGYNPSIDFIIIGEDTGPYSELPDKNEEMVNYPGKFIYIHNFLGPNPRSSVDSPICKGPAIDYMVRRDPAKDEPFGNFTETLRYIKKERGKLLETG